jgi:DNA helicase IV
LSTSAADREIAVEQRHVDRVYARLEVIRKEAEQAEAAGYNMARVGTFGALVERDAMVYHVARRRRLLDSEHEGLVFGRLDLRPGATLGPAATPGPDASPGADAPTTTGPDGGEVRYIGRLGLRDEDARPLVIDWRAPAAAAFYRATAVDPMGVVRRRIIQSSGEQVIGVEDDLLDPDAAGPDLHVIGDGALVATLARATGTGMRDIVSTIQKEQDEAIRSPALGVTVVRGGPGTGKTAVALHRAAYLLYSDRQRFASGGVLVVGPSPVFVSYISRVLPSLGEDEVTLGALGSLLVGVSATRHDTDEVATVKGSLRMAKVLARAVRDAAPDSPGQLRLLYRGTLLTLAGPELDKLREQLLGSGGKRNTVRPKAAGLVLDALWRQAGQLLGDRVAARGEFATEIAERREFVAFMGAWWPRLRPVQVLGWLADPVLAARYAHGLLSRAEVSTLAGSLARLAESGPSVEDVALLDELDDLLGAPPAPPARRGDPFVVGGVREVTTYADRQAAARAQAVARPEDYREYAHIVVDEAQDVSPMQWRMIGRRGEYASWTVVGDPAQAAWRGDPTETRKAMDAALGTRRRSEYTLSTNYRNSTEIFAVAAAVIRNAVPDADLPVAVRSSGVAPRRLTVPDLAAALPAATRQLLDEVAGTVGVVCAQASRDEVAGWLAPLDDPRLQVVTSLEAKGMEYDGVLVVEPVRILRESPVGARTLYVALSRATQRLTTVATDESWLPTA